MQYIQNKTSSRCTCAWVLHFTPLRRLSSFYHVVTNVCLLVNTLKPTPYLFVPGAMRYSLSQHAQSSLSTFLCRSNIFFILKQIALAWHFCAWFSLFFSMLVSIRQTKLSAAHGSFGERAVAATCDDSCRLQQQLEMLENALTSRCRHAHHLFPFW
jgi:hypothetical protein